MTPEEFGFWEVCRSLTYKKFNCHLIFDGRNMAANFGDTGKHTAYRLVNNLCKKGWLVCTKKSTHNGKGGHSTSAEYDVISHDEWVRKHGTKFCKSPVLEPVQAENSTVLESKRTSTGIETNQSWNRNEPVLEPVHSTVYTPTVHKPADHHAIAQGVAGLKPFTDSKGCTPRETVLVEAEHSHGSADNISTVLEPVQAKSTVLEPVLTEFVDWDAVERKVKQQELAAVNT
jgi:hypothetical protein